MLDALRNNHSTEILFDSLLFVHTYRLVLRSQIVFQRLMALPTPPGGLTSKVAAVEARDPATWSRAETSKAAMSESQKVLWRATQSLLASRCSRTM